MGNSGRPVCVVDDDEAVRDSLTFLLESSGFDVLAFDSAMAFLAGQNNRPLACLILDLHMPDVSGLELLQRLAERGLPCPVIVVSGRRDADLDQQIRAAGATAIISKPFDDEALLAEIGKTLAPG